MPAGGIHLCVAKKVATSLNMNLTMNYLVGSVSPDSWRNSDSTKEGTHFIDSEDSLDYDYDFFFEKYQEYLSNEFVLGYLIHLITDKYWHTNNFIATFVVPNQYEELNKACSNIIRQHQIPKLHLPSELVNPVDELDTSGIPKTINYLNSVNYLDNQDSTLDIEELNSRINETSLFIISELRRLKNHKPSISNKKT